MAGAFGVSLTTTEMALPAVAAHPFNSAVAAYNPEAAIEVAAIDTAVPIEANPFGPLHVTTELAGVTFAVRFNAEPSQTGELEPSTGIVGRGFTKAFTVAAGLSHPFKVAYTEYTPELTTVALGMLTVLVWA